MAHGWGWITISECCLRMLGVPVEQNPLWTRVRHVHHNSTYERRRSVHTTFATGLFHLRHNQRLPGFVERRKRLVCERVY